MPYGFVCGYPTARGDLYGGSHYLASAQDAAGLQAQATALALARWGEGEVGREVISHPVCKGKYRPWGPNGEQLFGCFRHSAARKKRIERAGLREGWVSFEQWPPPSVR